jgi:hypothetical protein
MPLFFNKMIRAGLAVAALALPPLFGNLAHAAGPQTEKRTEKEAAARKQPAITTEPASTTQKDQVDLAVTVYNSNIALVRDVRQIHLPSGIVPLHFEDVAASINPATVHFRSLVDPSKLNVIEQNYEFDLLDPQKLLQKYVGKEVTLVREEKDGGSTRWVETKAVLLASNGGSVRHIGPENITSTVDSYRGGLVWKIGNEIVTGMAVDSYRFPDLPENLYSRPTLVWMLENRGTESQRVEASYLTNNMNWNADYVLTVGRDEKSADLDGWVTLVNNSGVAYSNAKLQLVAGQLNRVEPPMARAKERFQAGVSAGAAPQFGQEAFSEYHLYTLARRTSIQNSESKQISLLTGSGVPVEKYLLVEGQQYWFRDSQGIGNPISQPVKVLYRFKNVEKSGLGIPLPAGTVRVYQADSKGGIQFVGEDRIDHTPKDETLKIHVGNAFDVVCERKETDYKKIATNVIELEYQITLRNHKDSAVTVEVREPIGGDWEVLSSNFKWTKLDATTLGFSIPVEKDGTATLDYRVRVKW